MDVRGHSAPLDRSSPAVLDRGTSMETALRFVALRALGIGKA